jgi:hypothetical protein
MAKKIRLMDEPAEEGLSSEEVQGSPDMDRLMKYAEQIDWKLWEILKLMRKQAGESET